jgi:hypothetical protein
MSFSAGIEDWSLVIDIDLVYGAAIINQKLNQLVLSFSRCIIESRFLKVVWLTWVDSIILKNLGHL